MDNSAAYFIQVAMFFLIIISCIKIRSKIRKTRKEKTLKSFGVLDFIKAFYMATYEEPEIISGQKVSRFHKMYNKYMSSFSSYSVKESSLLKIFGIPVAFIAVGCETVKETSTNEACCDRAPNTSVHLFHRGNPPGFLMNNYEDGKLIKNFVMKKLGVLGVRNKITMEYILTEQLSQLLDHVENLKDEENKIQVQDLFSAAIFNVIANFTSGAKVSATDPDFMEAHKIFTNFLHFPLLNWGFLHVVTKLCGVRELFGYSRLCDIINRSRKMMKKLIDERQSIMQMHDSGPSTLIDYFLLEGKKERDNGVPDPKFSPEQLVTVLQDLTVAGLDTISKFMEFFLMFMCLYPDVQDLVQKEIDAVIGTSALPRYFDCKARMNYTMATLWEVHRLSPVVPFINRYTAKDVIISGHHLKKGTFVLQCYLQLRFDETYWKRPFSFYPEHFLDADGMLIQDKVKRMMIFGKGARGCPGEQLAIATVFTFSVGILQKYNIRKRKDSDILGSMTKPGLANGLEPFQVRLMDR